MKDSVIKAKDFSKTYGDFVAVDKISIDVNRCEIPAAVCGVLLFYHVEIIPPGKIGDDHRDARAYTHPHHVVLTALHPRVSRAFI